MAIAMIGTPLALSLGVPLGTLMGGVLGWRSIFGIMSGLAVVLVAWVLLVVPDYPGQKNGERLSILPGVHDAGRAAYSGGDRRLDAGA